MTAIRLARGFTGRDLLVKFAGHYHGHSDALLAEAGSGLATLALPGSAGVTAATAAQTLVLPYNDLETIKNAFALHRDRIAAVIVEAAAANMGVVPPARGFNRELSRLTRQNGALSSSTRCSPVSGSAPPAGGVSRHPGWCTTAEAGSPTSSRSARSLVGVCRWPRSAAAAM